MNQWTQLNLLLANQPGVPQATPAPGFERLLTADRSEMVDQQITLGKNALKYIVN